MLCLISILSRLKRKPYPPGPTGLPFIGNMQLMDQLTHQGLAKLARHYGGLFHLKMGLVHVIVISSPDEAREVLQVQDIIFSNRPASVAISYLTYNRADLVFSHYGPFWRKMRKLCVVHLFSRKRAESWQSVRDEVDHILRAISDRAGLPVNVGELVFKLATNITYTAAFGSKVFKQQDEFLSILQEFSKLFGAFNIADYIPFLKWLDPSRLNDRLTKARFSLDRFVDEIIDDHMNNAKVDKVEEDMVDDLLNFYSEKPKVTDELGALQNAIKLTRDNIKGIIMDIMFGGTETIALVIEWLMTELLRNPEHMKRVQEEIADIVGLTRQVKESDLDKLPFFHCCIKETLRMHPPITLLLHETAEDAVINGYYIPKQSRVIINTWAIGRDPNSWYDPEMFKPTRFFEEGVPDFKGGDFEFLPFGSGRRSCPGMVLALYTLELCVANLLHCFTWKLPDGMKPHEVSVEESFGLTTPRASRLIAVPSPRLLCPIN
uniref:Cytochrome P450 n=1 Tax=Achyranthes bidentata TaxID=384659 RepID=A0A7G9U7T1_9CARY|nr:cytochrome P450 [Achyranthes bidentata]